MARSRYEYTTSPRKLQPDVRPQRHTKKKNLKVVEDVPRQDVKISKEQKKKQRSLTITVAILFILLLTISYRNSQINEKFTEVQSLKKELSSLEKENEQLEVSIENGLNLNTIEKLAKEKLGMQKLTNKQTLYVSLPKKDYVESASEEVVIEEESNWFQKLVDKIFKR
jgi:cell division protein FtsL